MFKLVVLSALIAIAAARPGIGHAAIAAPLVYAAGPVSASGYEYSASVLTPDYVNHQSVSAPLAGHAAIVRAYPEAISHQSQHVVHGKAALVTPLIAPAAVHSYHAPLIHEW